MEVLRGSHRNYRLGEANNYDPREVAEYHHAQRRTGTEGHRKSGHLYSRLDQPSWLIVDLVQFFLERTPPEQIIQLKSRRIDHHDVSQARFVRIGLPTTNRV